MAKYLGKSLPPVKAPILGKLTKISAMSSMRIALRLKTKQLLAQTLKAFFHIDEDPFWPYEEVKSYKIKIKLIS